MPTKLQIARARARVALSRRTGTAISDAARKTAAMDFSEAVDAVKAGTSGTGNEHRSPKHSLPVTSADTLGRRLADAVISDPGAIVVVPLSSFESVQKNLLEPRLTPRGVGDALFQLDDDESIRESSAAMVAKTLKEAGLADGWILAAREGPSQRRDPST